MVTKGYILSNLQQIERLYNESSTSIQKGLFYSKLAIIELCGWIHCCLIVNSTEKVVEKR